MTHCRLITESFRVLTVAWFASLVGCSVIPEKEPVQLLDLNLPAPDMAVQPASWTLNVNRPQADPARDSNRVLVRTTEGQLQLLPQARWVATSPELIRAQLLRYLRDANSLAQVSAGASGMARTLELDLRQFELVEGADKTLQARIMLEVRLYDNRSARLLARQIFSQQQDVATTTATAIISGFERVLGQVIPAIASWLTDFDGAARDGTEQNGTQ